MSEEIKAFVDNGAGIIVLNRPRAINALNPAMMEDIFRTLAKWRNDKNVRLVLLRGEGPRGFCAGGDVRWTRKAILEGRDADADDFFALEYSVNEMISTYVKPVVALTHGAVMGGGIGLAGHARFRFAHENARFAMPESAIGFFCDIGVQSLLARVSRARSLLFMLSGDSVGVADALALNLADCAVGGKDFSGLAEQIISCAGARDVPVALTQLMRQVSIPADNALFCQLADTHATCFEPRDLGEIFNRMAQASKDDPTLMPLVEMLEKRCPTSMWVHVLARDTATTNPDISVVLACDLRLAKLMARRADFCEGVRAVLVDKDQNPRWNPDDIARVDRQKLATALAD